MVQEDDVPYSLVSLTVLRVRGVFLGTSVLTSANFDTIVDA